MKSHRARRVMQRMTGFSLIELMVAIAIGSLMLALLAIVYSRSSWSRLELDKVTRVMENARFAVDVIGDDVRHAGFYGGVRPPGNAAYIDASPCTATFGVPKNFGWDAAAVPLEVPSPVLGFNNATGAIANLGCIQSRADGSDVVAIRRVSSLVTPVASLSASSVYVQAAQCATDPLLFKAGNDAATLDQKTFACVAGTVAPIREYFVRVYYLSTCNICSPSDNIPTLKRTEIRNGSISHTSLAEGVIGMQFEYGFDTTVAPGDGVPDVYLSNIDPDATKPEGRWSNVVSIRAHLLVRSVDPAMNAVVGTRTFALGPDQPAATCTAGYRCRLVTTTLRLNNVAGSREVP